MASSLKQLWQYRELIVILVQRNLKIRYKHSALGFFWTLISPLFMILIYAVFLGLMRIPIDLPVLVTGIIVWQFLAMCTGDALHAINGNANLVKKTAFPRIILVLSMVLANTVNFLLSMLVLLGYLLVAGATFGGLGWLPLALLLHLALCVGLSLLLACCNVFFRDTEHIINTVMLGWFFITPIIYTLDRLHERFGAEHWILNLYFVNPMAGIVTLYRMFLLGAPGYPGWGLPISGVICVLLLALGWFSFQRFERYFAEVL